MSVTVAEWRSPGDGRRVDDDAQYEAGLRPRTLDEYIGQDRVRDNLQVSIAGGPRPAARRSITCCSTVRLASARRRSPT